jgi:hypothetical protein
MKIFIITFLFIAATLLPILFIPLLALTLIILLIVSPEIAHNGFGMFSTEDKHELKPH